MTEDLARLGLAMLRSLIDQIWFNIAGQFWVLHQHS